MDRKQRKEVNKKDNGGKTNNRRITKVTIATTDTFPHCASEACQLIPTRASGAWFSPPNFSGCFLDGNADPSIYCMYEREGVSTTLYIAAQNSTYEDPHL